MNSHNKKGGSPIINPGTWRGIGRIGTLESEDRSGGPRNGETGARIGNGTEMEKSKLELVEFGTIQPKRNTVRLEVCFALESKPICK